MTVTLSAFQKWIEERWSKNPRPEDLAIMTIGLAGEIGEVVDEMGSLVVTGSKVTEHVKKAIRGSKPVDTTKLELEIGDVLHYLTAIANQFDISMERVMVKNIAKLEARAAAGDTQGRS